MTSKENVINSFWATTNTTISRTSPTSLKQTLTHLKLIVKNLPEKKINLQWDFAFPYKPSHLAGRPSISHKSI